MWEKVSVFVLRNRLAIILSVAILTAFMAYKASQVELTYDNPKFIPDKDPEFVAYQEFKKTFGDDGTVLAIGINSPKINDKDFFNDWCSLSDQIEKMDSIKKILSVANVTKLVLQSEDSLSPKSFVQQEIVTHQAASDEEVDSLLSEIRNLRFYEGILIKDTGHFTLMAITLEKGLLDSKKRISFVNNVVDLVNKTCKKHGVEPHYSGLPFIRTRFSSMVQEELQLFTIISMIVTGLILLFFFRSFYTLFFSLLVVGVGVVWSFGILVLLGYKITMFIGLLPPLIVVIGIANCIYLLNKYHDEFRAHQNKMKSLQRVISRVGIAVFFTNLTTAIGFGVFVLTGSTVLKEFGLTAFLSVMSVFVISIVLIPLIFSYLPEPSVKHTKHLDGKFLNKIIDRLSKIVSNHRKLVYVVTGAVVLLMFVGLAQLKTVGFMVDDISKSNKIYKDLKFFEQNINGILPFEVVLDTRRNGGISSPDILKKIDRFENELAKHPEFSKSISVAQVINFARQEANDGDPRFYGPPNKLELSTLVGYLSNNKTGKDGKMMGSLVDTNNQRARISVQMADVGSNRIKALKNEISAMADSIFNYKAKKIAVPTDSIVGIFPNDFDSSVMDTIYHNEYFWKFAEKEDSNQVYLTGTSVIFLKGNNYLNKNLMVSLIVAFLVIGGIMATIFTSMRMIMISLIPNIIPLLITAGLMGYFGVSLKPSTVLVFSVAFGIAVDFTIHFLSKYRMELKRNNYNIKKAVKKALNETGVSMIYTSVILFFGFIIFAGSSFGGTIALGVFTSLTLVVALFTNLLLLPSLLLSYDLAKERAKKKATPLIDYPDEES
ncbi:MAG: MMPL family transporter [Bacteroidia bacterium]